MSNAHAFHLTRPSAAMMEPFTTSEKTWAAMKSALSFEVVLRILTFADSTFYESRQANRFCYISQQESARLRALRAKTFLGQEANKILSRVLTNIVGQT